MDEEAGRERDTSVRRRLLLSALVTVGGLSLAGIAAPAGGARVAGGLVVVAGWLLFVNALHAFGRAEG